MRSTFEWVERGGGIKIGLYILPPTHTHHRIVSSAVYVHIARSKSRVLSKLGHTYFHPHTHHRIVSSAMYVQIARSKSRMLSPKTTTSKCRKQKIKTG